MLKYRLSSSELVARAGEYYRFTLDLKKQKMLNLAITELRYFDGQSVFVPKGGFQALFLRHEP